MKESLQKGKTLEEAIGKALEELNLGREDVEHEVLEESRRGLWGLLAAKEVSVRVWPKTTKKDKALEFIGKICSAIGVDVDITVEESADPQQISFHLKGERMGLLIGRRGQVIDALQYLTNIYTNNSADDEYVRVVIDVEGYREKRRQTLTALAKRLADSACRNRRKVVLEPMPPHERRIIHLTLQDDKRVVSYSEGDEPYRKVIIDFERTQ